MPSKENMTARLHDYINNNAFYDTYTDPTRPSWPILLTQLISDVTKEINKMTNNFSAYVYVPDGMFPSHHEPRIYNIDNCHPGPYENFVGDYETYNEAWEAANKAADVMEDENV